ncbi:UNVERIFIED_CONTAM: hypothetical protein Sradi_1937800 [Sesamum radiatum]|uniref:HMG box domain-containing protein n=1 Tax=Sesamum radiatum TaxID=300843 RepID=A0AAW2TDD6_SESRA
MVYQPRPRKRVLAIRRGPDGSAFQKCKGCGLTVAIALADMHECGVKKITKKKRKTRCGSGKIERQKIQDQPRSAFHFFMEEFVKTCKDGNEIEIDKKGCETWKNMSKEERRPFVLEADKLNSAYVKLLLKEESEMQWVDDEADSGDVGKYDEGTIMPLGYSETSLKIEHDHEASVYFPARRTRCNSSALARINWRQVILAIVSNVRLSCDVASASKECGRIDILSDVHVEKRVL